MASLNYTYTDTENLTTDRWLPREPQHRWNLGLTWEPIRRLSLFTQVHVDDQAVRAHAGGRTCTIRGYTAIDSAATYRLLERYGALQALDLTARIQNVPDEGYAEVRGFPALGINALVGLRRDFPVTRRTTSDRRRDELRGRGRREGRSW